MISIQIGFAPVAVTGTSQIIAPSAKPAKASPAAMIGLPLSGLEIHGVEDNSVGDRLGDAELRVIMIGEIKEKLLARLAPQFSR